MLAHGGGEHVGIVFLRDDPVAPLVLFQQRRGERVVAEAAAALPFDRLGNAALVLAVDHLLKTRDDNVSAWSRDLDLNQRRPIFWATAPVVPEPANEI